MKAVLFDLDGTLTNTLHDIATAMNHALRLHGLPEFEDDAYRYLVGDGAVKLASRAVRDRQELAVQVLEAYQAYYGVHSQDTTQPYPGIPEMLTELNRRGVAVCVFSNKPHADTVRIAAHYFPEVRFESVIGQKPGVPVKPDPAGALHSAEALGIAPGEFFYLGDSGVDMACAKAAGMHPVGVLWGFRGAEELRENGAEHLIERPDELLTLLDECKA